MRRRLFLAWVLGAFSPLGYAPGKESRAEGTSLSENTVDKTIPAVRLTLDARSDSLKLSYDVENRLEGPIYLFDRLYNLDAGRLSANWCYVTFDHDTAIVSRQLFPLPPGLIHEEPEVPYGRLLAPGERAGGLVRLKLPLKEYNPYRGFYPLAGTHVTVNLTKLVFQIGWAPAALRGGFPGEVDGEKLVWFGYYEVLQAQRLSSSPSEGVALQGMTVR